MTAELLKQKYHRSQLSAISHSDTKLTANSAFFSPSREAMSSLVSTLCASYCVRRTSLVEGGECSAAAASWGRLSNCSRAQFSASFLNCPQVSGSWPGTGHRTVSRTNEGAQFCMLASTRGSVSRAVSPGHVAATLLCLNYTFKDTIHCRLQEEDLWQWKDNL